MRRRGGSFHAEMDEEDHVQNDNVHFITPHYDGSDSPEPLDLSKMCLDDDFDKDDEEEDEEEIYTRGRSRSRSVHENDSDSAGVVVHGSNGLISNDNHSIDGNKSKIANLEKTGPLPVREVLTLKKGLEEATQQSMNKYQSNSNHVDEEEEERIAAEREKQQRALAAHSSSGTSPASMDATGRRVKILMLGDSGVGKSSLILRWTLDTFSPSLTSTVGVNFKSKKIALRGESMQVQVWDTAGQEQFHKITTSYYKGAQGIMLVYDVTDHKTLDNVAYWIKNIKSHASDSVQVALVGNKTDLRGLDPSKKCVETERGREIATQFGVPFFETSAKDSSNVNDGFITLVTHIVDCSNTTHKGGGASSNTVLSSSGHQQGERRSIVEKVDKPKLFSSLRRSSSNSTNGFSSARSSTTATSSTTSGSSSGASSPQVASSPEDKEKCSIS